MYWGKTAFDNLEKRDHEQYGYCYEIHTSSSPSLCRATTTTAATCNVFSFYTEKTLWVVLYVRNLMWSLCSSIKCIPFLVLLVCLAVCVKRLFRSQSYVGGFPFSRWWSVFVVTFVESILYDEWRVSPLLLAVAYLHYEKKEKLFFKVIFHAKL